ncbi:MAG: hypothetical protein O7A03_01955 [Alphaproteobacteria bacterium]|nr:hypothetical protein [Alphaproteobacteria bacterium]
MKLLSDRDVPRQTEIYREVQWTSLLVGSVLFVAAVTLLFWSLFEVGWRFSWLFVVAAILALILVRIAKIALGMFFASSMALGWRLRWTADGLFIRFRSYLNNNFSSDTPTVVRLESREVAWLKSRTDTPTTPGTDSGWIRRGHGWLEVSLRRVDLDPLERALAVEANLRSPKGGRAMDFPLKLTPHGTLRVQLDRPKRAAEALAKYFPVGLSGTKDDKAFEEMSEAECEDHIVDLLQAGDIMGAVKTARRVYGMSLADAQSFIKDLQRR